MHTCSGFTFLRPGKPHGLVEGLAAVLEVDDQFELRAPLLLHDGVKPEMQLGRMRYCLRD